MTKHEKVAIRSYKDQVVTLKDPMQLHSIPVTTSKNVFRVDQEVRHACKEILAISNQTGVAALLSQIAELSGSVNPYESAFCILIVGLNSILNFTGLYNKKPKPPNDTSIYNVAIIICGFLNWMSLATETVELHKISQLYIRSAFSFSWKDRELQIVKKKRVEIK